MWHGGVLADRIHRKAITSSSIFSCVIFVDLAMIFIVRSLLSNMRLMRSKEALMNHFTCSEFFSA
jgi:hypothetical protein